MKVAYIFPGQGAQTVGMGKEFYESSSEAREVFDKADQLISGLTDVIFKGPREKLTSTAYCQPAIFTYSLAALAAFQAHSKFQNIEPQFACGLSLGECAAVAAAGALSFAEALKLVERRASFMEEATRPQKGAMTAVIGFDCDQLVEICAKTGAQVANFNSPEQIVITGDAQKVAEASKIIENQGAKRVIPLDVSGAFHSSLMQSAVPKFEEELNKTVFQTPRFPVVSNVDGQSTDKPEDIRNNLAKQITSSVQWVGSIRYIAGQGVTDFIEIGPGNILKGLIRKINPALKVHNIKIPEDIDRLPF
ncbi:MAG: ACP S-malonyltransferase [Candidatus Omnitrophica bacterium]|nr:ACP S-malonyltransferase [Candidatus Omnitrophota bacterium]